MKRTLLPTLDKTIYIRINRSSEHYWQDHKRIQNLLAFAFKNGFTFNGNTVDTLDALKQIVSTIYACRRDVTHAQYLVLADNTVSASNEQLSCSAEKYRSAANNIVFLSYREARKMAA